MDKFININTLLAFVTVAREGSVSRASDVLNLTQPAISHQIKRLAKDTGVTLFRRTATGVAITADGAALLPKAEQVLKAMGDFQRSARQRIGNISGTLKIGTIVDPEFIRLGRLLGQLRTDFPDIQTQLIHGVSGDTIARLRHGQIDAGYYLSAPDIITPQDSADPIYAETLARFSYRVIAPAGWQDRITDADWPALARLPWIGTPPLSVHRHLLDRIFAQHGCRQNVVALVDQESSMLEMVRAGVGLSLCRDSIALHEQQAAGLAVCGSIAVPASLNFATLDRRRDNAAIAAVFALVRSIW